MRVWRGADPLLGLISLAFPDNLISILPYAFSIIFCLFSLVFRINIALAS